MKNLIPVNRFGEPEEVAHAVGFCITRIVLYYGEVLSINGECIPDYEQKSSDNRYGDLFLHRKNLEEVKTSPTRAGRVLYLIRP